MIKKKKVEKYLTIIQNRIKPGLDVENAVKSTDMVFEVIIKKP